MLGLIGFIENCTHSISFLSANFTQINLHVQQIFSKSRSGKWKVSLNVEDNFSPSNWSLLCWCWPVRKEKLIKSKARMVSIRHQGCKIMFYFYFIPTTIEVGFEKWLILHSYQNLSVFVFLNPELVVLSRISNVKKKGNLHNTQHSFTLFLVLHRLGFVQCYKNEKIWLFWVLLGM